MAVGSPEDLADFYRREFPQVVGTLSLYVGSQGVAEELAQEAFVRVCERWESVAAMDSPGGWLHRVAINLANSRFRRRSAERRALRRANLDTQFRAEEGASPDALAVRQALGRLPASERAALVLRFFAGYSVADTAAVLGSAEGSVKTWTHRGLGRLRGMGLIERDGAEVGDATN